MTAPYTRRLRSDFYDRQRVGIQPALNRFAVGVLQLPVDFRLADDAAVVNRFAALVEDLQLHLLDGFLRCEAHFFLLNDDRNRLGYRVIDLIVLRLLGSRYRRTEQNTKQHSNETF